MPIFDFTELESKFPEIIEQMPNQFDSHEFLLVLAQQNQVEYVKALNAYKDTINQGSPAPFQAVHGAIIQKLSKHRELVSLLRNDKPSKNIFGKSQNCGEWQKLD